MKIIRLSLSLLMVGWNVEAFSAGYPSNENMYRLRLDLGIVTDGDAVQRLDEHSNCHVETFQQKDGRKTFVAGCLAAVPMAYASDGGPLTPIGWGEFVSVGLLATAGTVVVVQAASNFAQPHFSALVSWSQGVSRKYKEPWLQAAGSALNAYLHQVTAARHLPWFKNEGVDANGDGTRNHDAPTDVDILDELEKASESGEEVLIDEVVDKYARRILEIGKRLDAAQAAGTPVEELPEELRRFLELQQRNIQRAHENIQRRNEEAARVDQLLKNFHGAILFGNRELAEQTAQQLPKDWREWAENVIKVLGPHRFR